MPVPTSIDDLSTTAGSNSPSGADSPGDGDNYIRALSAFIAQLRDGVATVDGVKFANSASVDTTTLDWYEEGSFTPVLKFGGASVGIAYAVQVGKFTRKGNRVSGNFEIVLTNRGSSTGSATISGIPYSNGSGAIVPVVTYSAEFTGVSGNPAGYISTSSSDVTFYQTGSGSPLDKANFTSNAQLCVYFDLQVA